MRHTDFIPHPDPAFDTFCGKRIFVTARWFNNTTHAGPWSDIESAFIP